MGKNKTKIMAHSILFVASSHTLTQSQVDGFRSQYGTTLILTLNAAAGILPQDSNPFDYWYCENSKWYTTEDEGFIATTKIVKQSKLQAMMSNIPAAATLAEIQSLAKAIVAEAIKAGATHFFCTGEPTLTMWANLYAARLCGDVLKTHPLYWNEGEVVNPQAPTKFQYKEFGTPITTRKQAMLCIQPTEAGWREMF